MSREDEVRRELEQAAAEQQVCPIEENIAAELGIISEGRKILKAGSKSGIKGMVQKAVGRGAAALRRATKGTGVKVRFTRKGPLK